MKILGIDYGSKRVGIAVSNFDNTMAFPKAVLPNDGKLVSEIKKICDENSIEKIVVGESQDFNMQDNAIMKDIRKFAVALNEELGIDIEYEPEFMSSAQAAHIQGEGSMLDASAATIILQSYLDKKINRAKN